MQSPQRNYSGSPGGALKPSVSGKMNVYFTGFWNRRHSHQPPCMAKSWTGLGPHTRTTWALKHKSNRYYGANRDLLRAKRSPKGYCFGSSMQQLQTGVGQPSKQPLAPSSRRLEVAKLPWPAETTRHMRIVLKSVR